MWQRNYIVRQRSVHGIKSDMPYIAQVDTLEEAYKAAYKWIINPFNNKKNTTQCIKTGKYYITQEHTVLIYLQSITPTMSFLEHCNLLQSHIDRVYILPQYNKKRGFFIRSDRFSEQELKEQIKISKLMRVISWLLLRYKTGGKDGNVG